MNYLDLPNLASPQLGGSIVFATDEWFAAAENVIKDDEPVWKQDEYTPFGKWMDGWESRRRRTEGHDWCIIKLGLPGFIRAIEIDTAFFTGNFSPQSSVYGILKPNDTDAVDALLNLRGESIRSRPEFGRMGLAASEEEWNQVHQLQSENWPVLIPLTPLGAGYEATRRSIFEVAPGLGPIQYLRLNMGPDGGIARIRVYGEVTINADSVPVNKEIDLAYIENGGMAISCSNKHYGHPRNLILPGRGNCMGDGWETARQPKRPPVYHKGSDGLMVLPGYDWAVLQLGTTSTTDKVNQLSFHFLGVNGVVSKLEVDTHFYKGNYPESCTVLAALASRDAHSMTDLLTEEAHERVEWKTLLPRTRLTADSKHFFSVDEKTLNEVGVVSHIKLVTYPDGGVMRLRVMGVKASNSRL